jgi:hypothetical protein
VAKKIFITVSKGTESYTFDRRIHAAEFLNISVTNLAHHESTGSRVKGFKIEFKDFNDQGCEHCGGTKANKKDDYCTACYDYLVTGRYIQSNTEMSAKPIDQIITPFRDI